MKGDTLTAEQFRNLPKAVGKGGRIVTNEKMLQRALKQSESPSPIQTKSSKIIVGIDPDTDKSGVGIYNTEKKELRLEQYDLFDLYDILLLSKSNGEDFFVNLEAGHTVKSTWHKGGNGMAKRVGANHEIGRQIEKILKRLSIPYELIKPCGYSDYKHEQFCEITGWPLSKPTNSEKRVGGLLAFNHK